jgi:serine/threonine-protein kinase RsbW
VQLVRVHMRREVGDRPLLLFESALAEIGANVLLYALAPGSAAPLVEFDLRLKAKTLTALLTDWGPPLHNHLTPAMPGPTSEAGRGLAIARKVLDELGYESDGEVNTWRLVKRL